MSDPIERIGPFQTEPGWMGFFTRNEAPDALQNGTRIEKINSQKGDGHQDGDTGTVIGSIDAEDAQEYLGAKPKGSKLAYFIEWDDMPRCAVGIGSERIQPLKWHSKTQ